MLRFGCRKSLAQARFVSFNAKKARDVLPALNVNFSEKSNGLRVVSAANGKPISTIGVFVDSGSRYETRENNGVASLLERLLYKGTQKRTAKQLESELGKYGARLNSYTSRDHTVYLVQVVNENVEKVVDILADVLRNSKFDAADVEAEKANLIKLLDEVETDYDEVAFDYLHTTAFQGTGLANSPYGRVESINNLSREDVINFADDHYKGSRVIVASVGGVDHGQLDKLASKYFGDLDNEYKRVVPPPLFGVRFTGSEFTYRDDNIPYMYSAVAVEGVGLGHHDALSLKLAAQVVGQWDRSHGASINHPIRAAQAISQVHDLQSYEAFSVNYSDAGLFGVRYVHTGAHIDDTLSVVNTVQRQWKHLAVGIRDEELDRAKNQLRTNWLQQFESGAALVQHLATTTLATGEPLAPAELEARINKLDASAVREAVSRHVYDRDLAVSGVGRTEAIPPYQIIRVSQSWWRL